MRYVAFLVALVFAFSLLTTSIYAVDTYDSVPSTSKVFLHNGTMVNLFGESVYNTQTKLYTVSLNIGIIDYASLSSNMLSIGCAFDNGLGFDEYAEYQYTISLVPSAGNTIDITSPDAYALYGTHTSAGATGTPIVADSVLLGMTPDIEVKDGVYTFTFKGIEYKNIANSFFIYIETNLKNIGLYTTGGGTELKFGLTFLNTFFGLESAYNEEIYQREVGAKLDEIKDSIDELGNKVDDVGDKVDENGDKIVGAIEGQIDEEINKNQEKADEVNGEAEEALEDMPDFSDSYESILENLLGVVSSHETQTSITLPDGNVELMGTSFDIWAGNSEVQFDTFLNNSYMQIIITISKCFSVLAAMACACYWGVQIKEWITADSSDPNDVDIPMLPKGR